MNFRIALVFTLMFTALAAAEEPQKGPDSAWAGCWRNDDEGPSMIRIDPDRVLFSISGNIMAGKILAVRPEGLRIRFQGVPAMLELRREGEDLVVLLRMPEAQDPGEPKKCRKLAETPAELDLKPLALGPSDPPAPERAGEIRKEMEARSKKDQEVRAWLFRDPQAYMKDPSIIARMQEVDRDNTSYLKKTLTEVGWLDAERFGKQTASAAFLIVQHSGDLPLMMAALPCIEKDLKAKRIDAQEYALLYDRCRMMLGEKQRYGSQMMPGKGGRLRVLPLEDRSKVEEFRKEIGLMPLSDYLKMAGMGKEPEFMEEEEEGKKAEKDEGKS